VYSPGIPATIYTDQAQGTAFAVFPTDDGGTWLATNSHVVEDAIRADRSVRLVQGDRSWRGQVATWADRPDIALIRVAGRPSHPQRRRVAKRR
jgi:S1-C subfamily serine protease